MGNEKPVLREYDERPKHSFHSEQIETLDIFLRFQNEYDDEELDAISDAITDLLWCDGIVEAVQRKLQNAITADGVTIVIHSAF